MRLQEAWSKDMDVAVPEARDNVLTGTVEDLDGLWNFDRRERTGGGNARALNDDGCISDGACMRRYIHGTAAESKTGALQTGRAGETESERGTYKQGTKATAKAFG